MKKLANGNYSTLGNWREIAILAFERDSPAVKFLDDKIKDQGDEMEVIAAESQMMILLAKIHLGKEKNGGENRI